MLAKCSSSNRLSARRRGLPFHSSALVRFMAADNAASGGTQDTVMASIVTGSTAD
jgi:hypothetical protein